MKRGVLVLLTAFACKASPPSSTPGVTDDAIRIGSYGPLSGPAAAWGVMLHGMKAYLDFINARGGVHGRRIELVYEDDQYSPAKTPLVARRLVEKHEVFAIVGGIGTANGQAIAGYLEEQGVPFFTPASGDRTWSDPGRPNVYTVYPRHDTEGRVMGAYLAGLGLLRVAVLHQDDAFGAQGAEGLEAGLGARGGELVARVTCQPTDIDVSGAMRQVLAASPDAFVLFTAPKQAVLAVHALPREARPKVLTSFVLSDPKMFELAGPEVWEGVVTAAKTVLPDADHPSARTYRAVLAAHGEGLPVGNFTLSGFHFAMPFVEALHRAGRELTREGLYLALESFDDYAGGGPHWEGGGLGPPITFSKARRLGHDRVYFAEARGGRFHAITGYLSP